VAVGVQRAGVGEGAQVRRLKPEDGRGAVGLCQHVRRLVGPSTAASSAGSAPSLLGTT
jgi:hypothetical protein